MSPAFCPSTFDSLTSAGATDRTCRVNRSPVSNDQYARGTVWKRQEIQNLE